MEEDIRYDSSDQELQDIVNSFLKEIEMIFKAECFEELELNEISDELSKITPTLSTILSKWVSEIIYGLYFRRMGFNEIKRMLSISSRVLSDKLKDLEEKGIVSRLVERGRPPRVYYELTDFGKRIALSLVPLFIVIKRWQ